MVRAGERQSRDGSQRLVIVTVAYHSQAPLEQLAADLARQQWQPERWLLVNNAPLSAPLQSQALALALALALAGGSLGLQLLEGEEGAGFGDGCNRAFTALAAEGFNGWVWLLNPDTSLRRGDECARLIAQLASLDRRSVVGTAVQASSGELEASGGWFDPGLRFRRRRVGSQLAQRQGPLAVDWLSGCSLVLQPEAHQPPARFDPAFPLYYEDLDLCLRPGRCDPGAPPESRCLLCGFAGRGSKPAELSDFGLLRRPAGPVRALDDRLVVLERQINVTGGVAGDPGVPAAQPDRGDASDDIERSRNPALPSPVIPAR